MPVYTTLCAECERRDSIYRKISERDSLPPCKCGGKLTRILDMPMLLPEIQPYLSPNGKYITSRAERREDLKKSNALPWEPGIDKQIAERRESLREKDFEPIAQGVDEIVRNMHTSGKLESLNA